MKIDTEEVLMMIERAKEESLSPVTGESVIADWDAKSTNHGVMQMFYRLQIAIIQKETQKLKEVV